jgi:hypothetical protein
VNSVALPSIPPSWAFAYVLLLTVVAPAAVALRSTWLRRRHQRLIEGSRCIEIHSPPQAELANAAALWSNLLGLLRPAWKRLLYGQPHLAFEYLFGSAGVTIRLWIPGTVPDGLVEHAVEAAWPSARTTTITAPDHPPTDEAAATSPRPPAAGQQPSDEATDHVLPVPLTGQATGGCLALARGEALPLRQRFDADPLRALLGAAVAMPSWQHASVQILARPATGRRLRTASAGLGPFRWPLIGLLDLLVPASPRSATPTPRATTDRADQLEQAAEARAAADKAAQSRYAVAIRYAVTADPVDDRDPQERQRIEELRANAIRGRAHAIASAFAVFAGHNRLERRRLRRPAQVLAARRLGHGQLVSVTELAALAHLPMDPAVPGLRRAGANSVPPSPAISSGGPYAKILGTANTGHGRPVALRVADSCHHLHVMGPNGTGKSTLLAQMILSDVAAGRGVVVIEAKGDLITDLLGLVPPDATSRVVLIDPDDRHTRPALNVLEAADRDMATDNLVGIFHKIYTDYWGPRTDDILRGCCLTLAHHGGTLADIPGLLNDPLYRRQLTAGLGDPLLRGFWDWYGGLSEAAQAHVTGPIMNKLRAFLLRPFVRDVLGSARSTFDLGDVLDGGILLVRLPKGVLGDDTARLLGSLVLAQVWQAAARRAKLGRARAYAGLYVDECHNFLTLPHALSDMLAEARAYRVSLTLAHQHLAQLPRELRQAISSDARNKVYFALSPEDASAVEPHFLPYLSAHDLANLDAFQAAARLIVRAAETPPFTLRTRPLPDPDRELAAQIRITASQTYGRSHAAAQPRPDDPRRGTTANTPTIGGSS